MWIDLKKITFPEGATDKASGPPEPIRPKGVSSRLPLLVPIALLALLFIGYRAVVDSAAWRAVETFYRANGEVRAAVGEVRSCRPWYPFKVDWRGDALLVQVSVQIKGTKGEGRGHALLRYDGKTWTLAAAALEDDRGRLRFLFRQGRSAHPPAMPRTAPRPKPASPPAQRSSAP